MKKYLKTALITFILGTSSQAPVLAQAIQPESGHQYRIELNSALDASLPDYRLKMPAEDHGTTVFGLPVNEGPIDRTLRGILAAGLITTGIYGLSTGQISAPISYTLLGVSAIPTLTAATGYCPLYSLVGIDYTF